MTYVYTKSTFQPKADAKTISKAFKMGLIALAAIAVVMTAFMMTGPKSKPTPLATQPAVIEMPVQQTTAKTKFKASSAVASAYSGVDSFIRNVQIDNAHWGHKMKVAMSSDENPIRRAFIAADRKFSLMAIMVGLAFVFVLFSFGFIRTSRDDLSNY